MELEFVENFVKRTVAEFGTSNPCEIAEKANVKIVFESWYPVTIGEFERKTKTIRVNRRAVAESETDGNLEKNIIAHELGHFFAADLKLNKAEEENFAQQFAETLVGAAKIV